MAMTTALMLSMLVYSVSSAVLRVNAENTTLFLGEDFHIPLPSFAVEVVFHPKTGPARREVVLMKERSVLSPRAKLNQPISHLILENVEKSDEGNYTIQSIEDPEDTRHIVLIVRDCSSEDLVKFGEDFSIGLAGVAPPISIEYQPGDAAANQTSRTRQRLFDKDSYKDGYENRLNVSETKVTLRGVTWADEGSYTINLNSNEKKKVCLNVIEHQDVVRLPRGATLKVNLFLDKSQVRLVYIRDSDSSPQTLLENGELKVPSDLEDRASLDVSVFILEGIKDSDAGEFRVTDLHHFPVAKVYLELEAFTLPPLYVAIIALVSLLVLLLLICLLSCLVKIRKRAEKARAIEKIAQSAGSEEGDAFRQVVKDACRQVEDTNIQSVKEDITEKSQSTEVSIKGLEVSSKEVTACDKNMETSDSGVGFNTTALPLDSDTDAVAVPIPDSAAPESKPALVPTPDPKPAPKSPEPEPKPDSGLKPSATSPPVSKVTVTAPSEAKPAVSPTPISPAAELAPASTPATKPALTPEPRPPSVPSPDPKQAVSPSPDLKPVLASTPEAKPAASPEPKVTVSPVPESKPAVTPTMEPKAVSPSPLDAKQSMSSPQPAKTPEPKPTTNGAPEPEPGSGPSAPGPDQIGGEPPKTALPKSPDTGKNVAKAPPADGAPGVEAKVDNDAAGVEKTD
ncbi:uncharacterized protein LOC114790695 [Denticeps clupeoides]|uniref:Uncharacterized protein n=1 Tax=Denticeps clupeoides TaxID=299321 RepID=A0AAY3ZWH2_9TELE|nr:uncharacterized protein LOC114790695 [Denticeps clupeoides]